MPPVIPSALHLQSLSTAIPHIFDQAQLSVTTHRKNCVALHKLQATVSSKPLASTAREEHLLTWLLRGFYARDKTVRLRSVTLAAELVVHLDELDEDVYASLRQGLVERALDKESSIRAPAIIALAKLLGGEDPNELPADEPSILEVLLEILCCDPMSDVRRAAFLHIPLTACTLSALLTRVRDVDPAIRTLMFSILTPTPAPAPGKANAKAVAGVPIAKLVHPRQLTLPNASRQDSAVRAAAAKDRTVVAGLAEFLQLFDVVGREGTNRANALTALLTCGRNAYWRALTPQSALLAREARLERAGLPVVATLAFYLQEACNALFDAVDELAEARTLTESLSAEQAEDEDEELERMEDKVARAGFVVGELLLLVVRCDFADENGRRKVFAVVREMLAHELLPEHLTEPCVDVLKETATGERELIRIVVETIAELRDDGDGDIVEHNGNDSMSGDTTQSSMRSRSLRRRARADAVDMRCLGLCVAMLTRVDGSFDENSTLEGVLADLVLPAVKRKEVALRERGLVCLGLCCLIAKNMAMSSFQLFINQVESAPEGLKSKVLQIVFDLLMVYDQELLCTSEEIAERVITFLLRTLEVEESDEVQAVLCVGISKLMLNGLVSDERALTSLVLTYVSPATAHNQELRQCLAYFLPTYCYSSPANQRCMQSLAINAYDLMLRAHEELEEGEMITPQQFGLLLVDWTNPQNVEYT
ncbi:nuclear condensing complex subunit [Amylocystis lapponica]|nr:nuclear condensing complex subunit [Amylocystis lapponica]